MCYVKDLELCARTLEESQVQLMEAMLYKEP